MVVDKGLKVKTQFFIYKMQQMRFQPFYSLKQKHIYAELTVELYKVNLYSL